MREARAKRVNSTQTTKPSLHKNPGNKPVFHHSRSQSELLEKIKKSSSAWIKTQADQYGSFFWRARYGCFSVGYSQLDELLRYIEKQESHHRTKTFQEEYRELLRKYRVDFDERYALD